MKERKGSFCLYINTGQGDSIPLPRRNQGANIMSLKPKTSVPGVQLFESGCEIISYVTLAHSPLYNVPLCLSTSEFFLYFNGWSAFCFRFYFLVT